MLIGPEQPAQPASTEEQKVDPTKHSRRKPATHAPKHQQTVQSEPAIKKTASIHKEQNLQGPDYLHHRRKLEVTTFQAK